LCPLPELSPSNELALSVPSAPWTHNLQRDFEQVTEQNKVDRGYTTLRDELDAMEGPSSPWGPFQPTLPTLRLAALDPFNWPRPKCPLSFRPARLPAAPVRPAASVIPQELRPISKRRVNSCRACANTAILLMPYVLHPNWKARRIPPSSRHVHSFPEPRIWRLNQRTKAAPRISRKRTSKSRKENGT